MVHEISELKCYYSQCYVFPIPEWVKRPWPKNEYPSTFCFNAWITKPYPPTFLQNLQKKGSWSVWSINFFNHFCSRVLLLFHKLDAKHNNTSIIFIGVIGAHCNIFKIGRIKRLVLAMLGQSWNAGRPYTLYSLYVIHLYIFIHFSTLPFVD